MMFDGEVIVYDVFLMVDLAVGIWWLSMVHYSQSLGFACHVMFDDSFLLVIGFIGGCLTRTWPLVGNNGFIILHNCPPMTLSEAE